MFDLRNASQIILKKTHTHTKTTQNNSNKNAANKIHVSHVNASMAQKKRQTPK